MRSHSPADPAPVEVSPPPDWRPVLPRRKGATKHRVLTEQIIADIDANVLPPRCRLPTHRELARRLNVSVQTVSLAYKEAERRGYLSGEVGRGTFVRSRAAERADRLMRERSRGEIADLSIIRAVYTLEHERASRALMAELAGCDNRAFMEPCRPVAGLDRHRAAARLWLGRLGAEAEADRVIVTNGAAQGLFLALAAIVQPGDVVLTECLTDHGVIGLANVLGFTLRGLPIDEEGVRPEAFDAACAAGPVVALVLIPSLGNPTSHVMGGERRRAIAAIAARHGVFVIEDEVGKPLLEERLPSIAGLIPELGFLATSFTKSVMTGMRVGYLVVPPRFAMRVASVLRVTGWSATNAMAEMASRWVEDGTAAALLDVQRRELRMRQAIVAEALGNWIAGSHPVSLSAWLRVPAGWTEEALVRVLARRGVAVTPSDPFVAGEERPAGGGIRICIGGDLTHASLQQALTTIAATFSQLPPINDAGTNA